MLVFFKAKQSQKEEKQIELFFPLFFLSSRRLVEIAEGCLNDAVPKKEGIHIFTFFFCTRKLIFRAPATSSHRIIKKKRRENKNKNKKERRCLVGLVFCCCCCCFTNTKVFFVLFCFLLVLSAIGAKKHSRALKYCRHTHTDKDTKRQLFGLFLAFFFWQTRHSEKCSSPLKKKEEKKKA